MSAASIKAKATAKRNKSSNKGSSSIPAGVDVAGRKASLATIAKTNPALAASLAPLATGGVQTKEQSRASMKAIKANRPTPVITPESLTQETPFSLPKPPAPTPVPDLSATNASLVGGGITTDTSGKLMVAPTTEPVADNKYAGLQNIFDSYLKQSQEIPLVNNENIYNQLYKKEGIAQKQQAVNDITSQINTIVANRDANVLRVTGQGRGIPEVIIGGQQEQINKEAAIAALPLQAQLAAAQGNLDTAQSHLDTMFKIKSADATAQYNYKTKLLDSVFDFATKIEQSKIEDLKLNESRKYQEKQDFIKAQNTALQNALGQGAPSSVYNAIKNATNLNEVTIAAGKYNGDVLAQQIKEAELKQKREGKVVNLPIVTLSPEKKQSLISAGFTAQEIDTIESEVSEFGLQTVLEGIDNDKQKKAIRDAYLNSSASDFSSKLEEVFGEDTGASTPAPVEENKGFWERLFGG